MDWTLIRDGDAFVVTFVLQLFCWVLIGCLNDIAMGRFAGLETHMPSGPYQVQFDIATLANDHLKSSGASLRSGNGILRHHCLGAARIDECGFLRCFGRSAHERKSLLHCVIVAVLYLIFVRQCVVERRMTEMTTPPPSSVFAT